MKESDVQRGLTHFLVTGEWLSSQALTSDETPKERQERFENGECACGNRVRLGQHHRMIDDEYICEQCL